MLVQELVFGRLILVSRAFAIVSSRKLTRNEADENPQAKVALELNFAPLRPKLTTKGPWNWS
jgi:hypothetical protein